MTLLHSGVGPLQNNDDKLKKENESLKLSLSNYENIIKQLTELWCSVFPNHPSTLKIREKTAYLTNNSKISRTETAQKPSTVPTLAQAAQKLQQHKTHPKTPKPQNPKTPIRYTQHYIKF